MKFHFYFKIFSLVTYISYFLSFPFCHFSSESITDIDDDLRLRFGAGIVHVGGFDHLDGLAVQRGGVEATAQVQAADVSVGMEPEFHDVGPFFSEAGGFGGIAEVVEGALGDLDDSAQIFVDEAALRTAHS